MRRADGEVRKGPPASPGRSFCPRGYVDAACPVTGSETASGSRSLADGPSAATGSLLSAIVFPAPTSSLRTRVRHPHLMKGRGTRSNVSRASNSDITVGEREAHGGPRRGHSKA